MKKLWLLAAVAAIVALATLTHGPPPPAGPDRLAITKAAELEAIGALIQSRGFNCPAVYSARFASDVDAVGRPLSVLCNNTVRFSVTLRQADIDAGKSNVEIFFGAIVKPL